MKKLIALLTAVVLSFTLLGCMSEGEHGKKEEADLAYKEAMKDGKIVVLVDAGHGLSDTGALHDENLGDTTEADINFEIASKLADELTIRGYVVIMSHDGKEKPHTAYSDGKPTYGPSERADYSNSTDADIFISIHCDSFPNDESVSGTRVYYAVNKQYKTKFDSRLASSFRDAIEDAFPKEKDVVIRKMNGQDSYTVLYKTKVPALLVECGFITNKKDAENLTSEIWQDEFASALADGVDKYFEH